MALKNGNPCLITFALWFAGHAQFMKVKKAARNCKKSSAGTLRGILEYAKDSEWGKAPCQRNRNRLTQIFPSGLTGRTSTRLCSVRSFCVSTESSSQTEPFSRPMVG